MITWLSILSTVITKLPIPIVERWLSYLEKRDDTDTTRLREWIKGTLDARRMATDVLIAEQAWWFTAMIRPMIAWPFIIYVWKTVVWDTVLGQGTTPVLQGSLGEWAGIIITAYFVGRPLEKGVASVVKNWRK